MSTERREIKKIEQVGKNSILITFKGKNTGGSGGSGGVLGCLIGIILIGFMFFCISGYLVDSFKLNMYGKFSKEKFDISIVDKVETTRSSTRYKDGIVTAFELQLKNNSRLTVEFIEGKLVFCNKDNEQLAICSTILNLYAAPGEKASTVLYLECENNNSAIELNNTTIENLSATFEPTRIRFVFEDGGSSDKKYSVDPITVLQIGTTGKEPNKNNDSTDDANIDLLSEVKKVAGEDTLLPDNYLATDYTPNYQCYSFLDDKNYDAFYIFFKLMKKKTIPFILILSTNY